MGVERAAGVQLRLDDTSQHAVALLPATQITADRYNAVAEQLGVRLATAFFDGVNSMR